MKRKVKADVLQHFLGQNMVAGHRPGSHRGSGYTGLAGIFSTLSARGRLLLNAGSAGKIRLSLGSRFNFRSSFKV